MSRVARLATCLLLAALTPGLIPALTPAVVSGQGRSVPTPHRGFTAAPRVLRAYDAILNGHFDEVPRLLRDTCAPVVAAPGTPPAGTFAPAEACLVLEAISLWWQIQIDPYSTRLDAAFTAKVDAAIAAAEAWAAREPQRAEAWFYTGGAYGARVQWRVLRGERIAAARDGKRIKDTLERALAIDAGLQDAWFGIGLYHYYADIAPTAAKMLRWLLFLPGGDRVQGLREMLRARDAGTMVRSEADYQLHVLYLWYEKRPDRAVELLRDLQRRHPSNGHFPQLIAEIQDTYQHDLTASLRTWRALHDTAQGRTLAQAPLALTAARLGMALQLDRLSESDLAVEHLRAVIASKPAAPYGAVAQAGLQLGAALDKLGQRAEAVAAYRAALVAVPTGDPLRLVARLRAGLDRTPDSRTSEAYRLSLEGLRALERADLAAASRALTRASALDPDSIVTRYRLARLRLAERRDAEALALLDAITRTRTAAPPTALASACVDAARLHEARGASARAIELYRQALQVFGADAQTKTDARRALARLDVAP